jgi:MOSC domain-containing protein YiiM
MQAMSGQVVAVAQDATHRFSKRQVAEITLIAGQGVAGDAHCGVTVKHRSRVRQDPTQPNLRQVHLIQAALFAELDAKGFTITPGEIGENITTEGLDLLALPVDTELRIGESVVVVLTGLRNPCNQLDNHKPGLTAAVLDRDAAGTLIRKAGVMGIVATGGVIRPGDALAVRLPPLPHRALERV